MNAAAHQLTAGAAVGLFLADRQQRTGEAMVHPVLGGLAASVLTKLPDMLEPATSPHHRQFFHSLGVACVLAVGAHKLHQWQPGDRRGRFVKAVGLLTISGYLIHLALDATTAKSLPLIGKL